MGKLSRFGIIALVAVLLFLIPAVALAQPPAAHWYGTVTVKGVDAGAGVLVTAWVNLAEVGRTTTVMDAGKSLYAILVTGDPATLAGKPVFFLVGDVALGQQAAQNGTWTSGTSTSLNLTYTTPAPTPTPTATPAPTPAPTPTATPAPTATPKPPTPPTGDDSLSTLIPVVMAGGVLMFIIGAAVLRKGATRKV
ncbi:MAG: hypothetical protein Q8O76_11040 [Chloroflexota bacterium]|nr:hypothetical protein [Chloroflexota bacterium]